MFGRKKKKGGGVGMEDVAAVEAGCCLLELIGAAVSCVGLVMIVPLLLR